MRTICGKLFERRELAYRPSHRFFGRSDYTDGTSLTLRCGVDECELNTSVHLLENLCDIVRMYYIYLECVAWGQG